MAMVRDPITGELYDDGTGGPETSGGNPTPPPFVPGTPDHPNYDVGGQPGGVDPWGQHPGDPSYGYPPGTDPYWDRPGGMANKPGGGNPLVIDNGGGGRGNAQWNTPAYNGPWAPDLSWWQDAPKFQFDAPAAFQAPTLADAQNEPGYAFARDEGLHALTSNRAAQGLARTGGTLKDLVTWGNKFADQNYSGVYNRKAGEYDRNFNNLFGIAKAQYEPQLTGWGQKMSQFGSAATQAFNRAWDAYKFSADDAYRHWNTIYAGGAPPA